MGRHPGNNKSHVEGLTKVNKILGDNQKIQEGINAFTQRHVQATIAVRKAQTAVNHELLRAKATQALFNADIWLAQRAWNGLLSTLQKATGLLGKLSFGLFTGKTAGSVGQAAGIIGASRGIEDLIQKVPLLSQTLKDNIQTFATWTRTVTEAIASVSIAYTGLSAALSAAKWVTGAVSGFVQWEKQAAQSVWNVQRAFNSLDQRMAANLDKNRNIATGFGGWISKALRGGEGRIEQKRTSLQGPTDQQRISEELRQQTQYLVNRNTTAKDYITIQQRVYALEREQTKEINMRRQMEVKAGKPIREVYEKEVTAADEAIKRIDAMRQKSISNAIAANDRINSGDKKAALEKLRLEKEAVAQKAKELKMSQDILLTVKKHNWELRRARRIKRVEQRRQRAATRGRFTENLMLGAGFPLLFGGGAGAVGGGVLGAGIQAGMGSKGFGMQIFFSAIGQQIDAFAAKTVALGQALDITRGNVETVTAAIGASGTRFGDQLKKLEELEGKEAALIVARTQMVKLVGEKGVKALEDFGDSAGEFGRQWSIAITQMQAGLAKLIQQSKIFSGLSNQLSKANLWRQATRSDNPVIKDLFKELEQAQKGILLGNMTPGRSKQGRSVNEIRDLIRQEQTRDNLSQQVDLTGRNFDTQLTKNLDPIAEKKRELEMVLEMGTREAGIQQQIAEIVKEQGFTIGTISAEHLALIDAKVRALQITKEQVLEEEKMKAFYEQIGAVIKDGMVDSIWQAIEGTKTLGETAANVFRQIAKMMLNYGITAAFGKKGLGWLPGMAKGGPVTGDKSYIVGERGPELFTPKHSGRITPNHQLGGTNNVVVNVDASGGTGVTGDDARAAELGRLLSNAVQDELVKQKRPGGILTR